MNDFLQSIRNGNYSKDNHNGNKQRYNQRPRRQYEPNGNYSRNNHDKKFRPRHSNDNAINDETLTAIRETLESIASNQEAALIIAERRALAEERKADAFEFIAANIGNISFAKVNGETNDIIEEAVAPAEPVEVPEEPQKAETAPETEEADMNKDEVLKMIFKMRDEGSTYNEIANHLAGLNLPTFSGRGKWHAQTIHRLCQTL